MFTKSLGNDPPDGIKSQRKSKISQPGALRKHTSFLCTFLLILGVILGSPKSVFFAFLFDVFEDLDRKVPQGGLKDVFLHPRTSKLSFPDPLRGQFLLTNVLEMYEKL